MDLSNLLKILLQDGFDFVLIGGFAGTVHGSNLVTKDLDICMALKPHEITQLRNVLKDFNPFHRMTPQKLSFLKHPECLENIKNLYLASDLGSLDILSYVDGVGDFERVRQKALTISLFGKDCKVISIDDLISSKKNVGRDKDRIAVKELEEIKRIQSGS